MPFWAKQTVISSTEFISFLKAEKGDGRGFSSVAVYSLPSAPNNLSEVYLE